MATTTRAPAVGRVMRSVADAGERVAAGATDVVGGAVRRRLVGARMPRPPERLRRPRPLAAPPAGSDLRPVMGEAGPPGIGWTLQFMYEPERFVAEQRERYGDVFWFDGYGTRIVAACGPEAVEQVLVDRDRAFVSGPAWSHFIGPFFGGGLMLLDGDEHRHDRRVMQHAFTRPRLTAYLARLQPVLRDGIAGWGHLATPGRRRVYPLLKDLTLDVAVAVFMGLEPHHHQRLTRAFVDTVRAGTGLVRVGGVPLTRWHRGLHGRRVLEAFLRAELPARRGADGDDLFTVLCNVRDEDGTNDSGGATGPPAFSDRQVVDHMVFLLMAAHDTSTITLTAMLHELARHPAWQERCRAEVDVLAARVGDGPLTLADVDELVELDLVMREALRLVTPVPSIPRRAVTDVDLVGFHLPAGSHVAVTPFVNHLDGGWWPAPRRFDPERFAEDRREDRVHAGAWLPFGSGVHKCIGMHFGRLEVLAAMYELLRTTRVTAPDGYATTWDLTSLPVPADGLPLTLAPR